MPEAAAGSSAAVADHGGGRYRLHAAVTTALCTAARRRPLVLLDDLHWADAPTLALLRHLARATADAPLLMLASAREVAAETAPDLADALADVHRLDGVTRLRLGGLAPPEIAEFLRRLAPRADEGRLVELADGLADVTGGNAFLMAEVGHHLADAGLLDDDAAPTARSRAWACRRASATSPPSGSRACRRTAAT